MAQFLEVLIKYLQCVLVKYHQKNISVLLIAAGSNGGVTLSSLMHALFEILWAKESAL